MRWPFRQDIHRPGGRRYLTRYMLFPKNSWGNVYLHLFEGPDWAEDLHDHPYWSLAVGLWGSYVEEYQEEPPAKRKLIRTIRPGSVTIRSPRMAHAIRALVREKGKEHRPVWTLFFRGPTVGEWGFWRKGWWIRWDEYIKRHF